MHLIPTQGAQKPSVQRIVRAAGACFGRKGYVGASMMEIAHEAGVSKSLLHYHFESKEHLFLEVQLLLCTELLHRVEALDLGSRPTDHFRRAVSEVHRFIERDLDQMKVLLEFRSVAAANPRIADGVTRFYDEILSLLVQGITNALGPLVPRLAIPVPRLARVLLTIFHGLIVDLSFATEADARQLISETVSDIQMILERSLLPDMMGGG